MEKKNKKTVIIGIISLFLITLILLGLTYAYYRTRIIGNNSTDPSVSVSNKKMEVTYLDGDTTMNITGLIEPGFIATKTFYVENKQSESGKYSVILDNISNEFERNEDWQITLTKNGETVISESDNVSIVVGTHQILLGSQTIAPRINNTESNKDVYVLTIKYINKDEDQSADMKKTLSFRVNISDESWTWETSLEGSLLYALKNNQPSGTETTIPGQTVSTSNEARIVEIEDDYGTSYVYRGNVVNNYVTYSGMCWRVLRVQGDGTIKLILADETNVCNKDTSSSTSKTALINNGDPVPYIPMDGNTNEKEKWTVYENGQIPSVLNGWMNKKITNTDGSVVREKNLDTSRLTNTDWCNDTSIAKLDSYGINSEGNTVYEEALATQGWYTNYNYGATERLANLSIAEPDLRCNKRGLNDSQSTRFESNIGLITADEYVIAGGAVETVPSQFFYLIDNANQYYWTMSPYIYDAKEEIAGYKSQVWRVGSDGNLEGYGVGTYRAIRPVIVLRSDVTIEDGGVGTAENPYIIW